MTAVLLLVGLLVLLLALPLAPLAGAIFVAARVFTSNKPLTSRSNLLLLLALVLCLLPYVYVYGRQIYRNSLCRSEGLSDASFVAETWARQHPDEAAAIGPAPERSRRQIDPGKYVEPLNSRFTSIEQFHDRGLSVTEAHLMVVDVATGKVVAETRSFQLPLGHGNELISFEIQAPQECSSSPQYFSLLDSLRRMGRGE